MSQCYMLTSLSRSSMAASNPSVLSFTLWPIGQQVLSSGHPSSQGYSNVDVLGRDSYRARDSALR